MYLFGKSNKLGSARAQVDIKEVKNGVLVLSGNRYRMILKTSSLNFELQSEEEQDVIVDTFQSFLNSLNSPIQILIKVRELDIDRYIEEFRQKRQHEQKKIFKDQLENYCSFIKKLVSGNKILSRRFYLVIPFDSKSKIDFSVAFEQLKLEQEIISKGLEKLGMTSKPLTTLEVLDLFYNFYRPDQVKSQPLIKEILRSGYEKSLI
jgi:hypothetical protein